VLENSAASQDQLFYAFNLTDPMPRDHLLRGIHRLVSVNCANTWHRFTATLVDRHGQFSMSDARSSSMKNVPFLLHATDANLAVLAKRPPES